RLAFRAAGIRGVNLDLTFGVPGQTLEDVRRDLDAALALAPDHVSTYGLTYEPGTAMTEALERGEVRSIPDGREAAMYAFLRRGLHAAGFRHYEISNFARPG